MLPIRGIDPDDVCQDILMGFLGRNAGKNPYNPDVSSKSTYVHLVIQSVVRNAIDSAERARRRNGELGGKDDVAVSPVGLPRTEADPMWPPLTCHVGRGS